MCRKKVRTVLGPAPMRIARPDGAIVDCVTRSFQRTGKLVYAAIQLSMFSAFISDVRSIGDAR